MMKTSVVILTVFLVVFTVDARRRFRPDQRNLSQCERVVGGRHEDFKGCEDVKESILGDLATVHAESNEWVHVLQRWVDDRRRALDPNIDFHVLLDSGSCDRMVCFREAVDQYMNRADYQSPHFCDPNGRKYLIKSLTIRRTRHWNIEDMATVFCAKAFDHNFRFH